MIYPSGTRTFFLYVASINGSTPKKIKLGRFPEVSIEQARNMAMEMKVSITMGKDPQEERSAKRKEITFDELFTIYMEKHAKLHKKRWRDDEKQYDCYVKKKFGSQILSNITREKMQELHARLGINNGHVTANRVLALISTVFARSIEWGMWERDNPVRHIRKFKEKSRERFLVRGELPRFLKSLNEEENTTVRDYIWISLLTGARKANVLAMRWEDINFDAEVWTIPAEQSKNQESMSVPLVERALNILRQRLADREDESCIFVFPGIGSTGHLVEPKTVWKRILDRAEIEDLRIHDLRRTFGSWQAASGASSFVIGKSLGHKSPQATAIYARLHLDPVRASVEKAIDENITPCM